MRCVQACRLRASSGFCSLSVVTVVPPFAIFACCALALCAYCNSLEQCSLQVDPASLKFKHSTETKQNKVRHATEIQTCRQKFLTFYFTVLKTLQRRPKYARSRHVRHTTQLRRRTDHRSSPLRERERGPFACWHNFGFLVLCEWFADLCFVLV